MAGVGTPGVDAVEGPEDAVRGLFPAQSDLFLTGEHGRVIPQCELSSVRFGKLFVLQIITIIRSFCV
jgi:hypothetical protein